MQTTLFGTEVLEPVKSKTKPAAKKRVSTKKVSAGKALAASMPPITVSDDAIGGIPGADKILGVSDYLDYINQILKVTGDVKVLGEISKLSNHPTGVYMTLKDKEGDGVLDCYINPYTYRGLGMPLEEGMEVKITGIPGIFKRRSQLSFKVESVELTGEGTLKKAYELLKIKLEQEGLFDRKRELPEFISSIGIITSKTGAVIGDFRNNLAALGCKLYMIDCRVEGAQSANQVIDAIRHFNIKQPDLDCLVVMRGGGSLEDMQSFNSEAVVKEIFASRIPVIAALGHDRDVPLACLAADTYTSTPTAAAVLINNSWSRLVVQLPQLERMLYHAFDTVLNNEQSKLINLTHQLTGSFNNVFQRFNYLSEKILRGAGMIEAALLETKTKAITIIKTCVLQLEHQLQRHADDLVGIEKLLMTASPERTLKLGYSLAYNAQGRIIRTANQVATGDRITVQLHKGTIDTEVIKSDNHD